MSHNTRKSRKRSVAYEWDKEQIRALRQHLGKTQREMADELEVRQQTISEWETGAHNPHRSTKKVLSMIAEQAQFTYDPAAQPGDDSEKTP
ncbi:MAG TPA: helix-turn-helix transcriptional regulator [Roseiflexaceae bacterium]|jgi:DNA-binding transcriptional regulator YiaG|nr:helix-turn-helix transcriptional regulator [Roseiflexaceae bacterium]